jgi:uncharacterized membrane protein YbhN (UPF0104 family)
MTKRLLRLAGPVTTVALAAGAIYLLNRSLRDVRWVDLWPALREVPRSSVFAAIGFTALSHLALTFYDYIGVIYIRRRLAYWRVAVAAFMAYSISHSLGFAAVTGGTVRYRMYSRWGFGAVEVAQIMAMAGVTLALGMLLIGGVALLLDGRQVQDWTDLPSAGINALGAAALVIVAGYAVIGFLRREPLRLWGFQLDIPTPRFAALQIALSGTDWLAGAAAFYVLLPAAPHLAFPTFVGVFVIAYMMGTLSNIPGGLGVFESIILITLRQELPTEAIVSALLVYRAVYHLLPLSIGGPAYLLTELRRAGRKTGAGRGSLARDKPGTILRHRSARDLGSS